MHNTPAPPKRYFLSIDGFRLLASVNIVLFHLHGIGGLWDLREHPAWVFTIIKGPAFHASVFFLLGGFIFTIKFADKARSFDTWSFIRKRFIELYPLHLITTLVMAGLILKVEHDAGTLVLSKFIGSVGLHLSLLWALLPFGYALNRPSWALSAFFLCYLLFGTALNKVMTIQRKSWCIIFLVCCMVPISLWTLLFGVIGTPAGLYHIFHTFAPIRFFEFLMGMLLARFFLLSQKVDGSTWKEKLRNDGMIIAAVALIFITLQFSNRDNSFLVYLNYHVTLLPLYIIILYGLATEQGIISRILALPVIRKTGRSSFYPYLIHIPLISVITYILEHRFFYNQFLHRPVNIVLFILVLYSGAYFYVNYMRARKPSGPVKTVV